MCTCCGTQSVYTPSQGLSKQTRHCAAWQAAVTVSKPHVEEAQDTHLFLWKTGRSLAHRVRLVAFATCSNVGAAHVFRPPAKRSAPRDDRAC